MRATSPIYKSPKSSQNQAHQRKLQLLDLSAKLLPQLLEKTLGPRLTALEKASSTLIQDIFTIRSDVREISEKTSTFIGDQNQSQSIPQLSQYTSPDTSVINEKIKSIPFIATGSNSNEFKPAETRKGGRLSPLSPLVGSPNRDTLQDLTTHMFTYESPKSSNFQEFQTPPKQARKNPFEFLLKSIEAVTQISRRELAELRSLINPSPGVTSVMEALCIVFDKKPKWPVARDLIESGDIIERIVSYDVNNLEQKTFEKIDLYVKSPLIEYEKMKILCPVAAVIWKWIRALHYCFISIAKAQKEGIQFEQLTTNYMTYMTKEEEELEKEEKPEKEYKIEPKPVKMSEKKQSDSSTMSEDQDKRLIEATKRVKTIQWRDLLNVLLMKSFPIEIKVLFETICAVQGNEPTWENAKLLIKKGCFLENVESVKPELLSKTAQEMIKEVLAMTMPLQMEFPLIEILKTWLGILDSLVVEKDKKQASILKEDEHKIEHQELQDVEKSIIRKVSLAESSPTVSRKGSDIASKTVSRKGSDSKKTLSRQSTNSFNAKLDLNETIPNIPMIQEVLAIFKGLKRSDFVELKRNRDIPTVRAVLEGLYLVFEVPPKVRIDMRTVGNLDFDRLAGDLDQLLTKIFQFNYDEIPPNLIIKLREHTRQPKCSIASAKSVSLGVWVLCLWLHVLVRFSETRDSLGYPEGYVLVPSPAHKKLEDIIPLSVRGKSNSFSLSPSKSSVTSTQRPTPMRDHKILVDTDKEVDSNKFTLEFEDPQLNAQFANSYFSITDILEFKGKSHPTKLTETIMKVFYTILTGRKLQVKEIQKALPSDGKTLNGLMNISLSSISVRAIKLAESEWKEIKNAEKLLNQSSTIFAIFKWIQTILEAQSQQKDESKQLLKKKSEGRRDSNLEMIIQEELSFSVIPEEQAVPDSGSTSRRRLNNKSILRMKSADLYNCDVEEIQSSSYLQRNLNEIKKEITDSQAEDGSSFMTNNLRSIVKEMKRDENEANNMHWDGLLANKEHRNQLKTVLVGDNEVDASNRELETYFSQKLDRYSTKINHLKTLNKLLTDNGVPTNPVQKEYAMKAGTASFIKMIEPEWIRNLMNQPYWDVLIRKILAVFVTIYGDKEAIDMSDDTELREQITEDLKKIQGNTVLAMLEIGSHLELDTKIKIKIQKLLKQQKDILNPRSFDGIDGFCGVLSFLLKEVCEYLGILPIDMTKKLNSKERLYLFNLQKIEYYESQVEKISQVASQRQLAL